MKLPTAVRWIGFAALLGLVAALVCSAAFPRPWILPDGTRLRYVGATYGTNHPSPLKHVWERWPLPAFLARRLPSEGWGRDWPSQGPAFLLWFRTDRTVSPEESYRWDLADESGLVAADFNFLQLTATNGATGLRLDYGAFPRHGRRLRLIAQHYDRGSNCYRPVLELELPNPRPLGPANPTNVPPLPQTVRDGELAFTLTTFTTGLQRHSGFSLVPASSNSEPTARLDFLTLSHGVPNRTWFPLNARLADLDGHALNAQPIDWLGSQNGWSLKLEPAPWAGQPWRLKVEFSRNEGFAEDELTTFKGLPLPGVDGELLDLRRTIGGREFVVSRVRQGADDRDWKVQARLTRREPGVSLTLLEARDNRGRRLWHHPRHLAFREWTDTESVDLTFAVHTSRFAEFVAEPTDVRTR